MVGRAIAHSLSEALNQLPPSAMCCLVQAVWVIAHEAEEQYLQVLSKSQRKRPQAANADACVQTLCCDQIKLNAAGIATKECCPINQESLKFL